MDYIRLKDVYKTMKGTQVLKGVNLTVEQGDIVRYNGELMVPGKQWFYEQ